MKLLVCGSPDFHDHKFVFATLDRIHAHRPIDTVIRGDRDGVDFWAGEWARAREIFTVRQDVHQEAHPEVMRNQRLLAMRPDGVLAIAPDRWATDLVARARIEGLKVMEAEYITQQRKVKANGRKR